MAEVLEDITFDITVKHRKERKDLQAKIQSLKKSASKGDKKKRKEILEEIAKLEIELEKRQAQELNDLNNVKTIGQHKVEDNTLSEPPLLSPLSLEDEDVKSQEEQQPRISKAQRRRDKKAREEREKQAEILAQIESNKNGPRIQELRAITKILKERDLCIHTIPSDGDCLYNAIRHQLEITNGKNFDVSYLRNETANYILRNKENLIFYMTNPETGDILNDEEFENYCETLRNTAAWGGQIEIKALSNILKTPIEVLQATGPPTIQGEEYKSTTTTLVITYHRHMYSLGEHYNSTKPFNKEATKTSETSLNEDEIEIE